MGLPNGRFESVLIGNRGKNGFGRLIVIAEEVKGGGRRSSRKLRDHEAKQGLVTEDKVKKTEGLGGSEARRREAGAPCC